jgi:hypothetical protein
MDLETAMKAYRIDHINPDVLNLENTAVVSRGTPTLTTEYQKEEQVTLGNLYEMALHYRYLIPEGVPIFATGSYWERVPAGEKGKSPHVSHPYLILCKERLVIGMCNLAHAPFPPNAQFLHIKEQANALAA